MQIIETMTLNETVDRLRQLGVHTTARRVSTAIQNGQYPWGICIPGEKNGCLRPTPSCLTRGSQSDLRRWRDEPGQLDFMAPRDADQRP